MLILALFKNRAVVILMTKMFILIECGDNFLYTFASIGSIGSIQIFVPTL